MSVYLRGAGITAVALTTVLVCAGCLGLAPSGTPTDAASPEPRPTADANASGQPADASVIPLGVQTGDVVATGTLSSPDGSVNGNVMVVSAGDGNYTAEFDNLSITRNPVMSVGFSVEPWDDQRYCEDSFSVYSYGDSDLLSNPTMDFWFAQHMPEDPTFLDTVVISQGLPAEGDPGCYYPVVATAPLDWTMPDQRPDLNPVDSGETGGAHGPVETVNGVLDSYTVVPNDLIEEIAARFGISVDDVFYLNPQRDVNPLLEVGDVINLAKGSR